MNSENTIINPLTNKRIKIGGETHLRLIRQGVVNPIISLDEAVQKKDKRIKDDFKLKARCEDSDHAREVKKELMKTHPLPEGFKYQCVDNNIYVCKQQPRAQHTTVGDIQKNYCESAVKVSKELLSNEDFVQRLKNNDQTLIKDIKRLMAQNIISDASMASLKEADEKLNKNKSKKKKETDASTNSYHETETGTRVSKAPSRSKSKIKFISDTECLSTTDTDVRPSTVSKGNNKQRGISRKQVPETSSSSEYSTEASDSEMD